MSAEPKELKDVRVGDLVIRTAHLKDAAILPVKNVTTARVTVFDEDSGKDQVFRKTDGRVIGGLHDSWSIPYISAATAGELAGVRKEARKREICKALARKNWEWFSLTTFGLN